MQNVTGRETPGHALGVIFRHAVNLTTRGPDQRYRYAAVALTTSEKAAGEKQACFFFFLTNMEVMPLSTPCFAKPQMLTQRIFHHDSLQLLVPCKKHVSRAWKIAVFFTPFLRLNWLHLFLVLIICKIIAKINVVLQIKHLIWRSASNCGPSVFFCYTKGVCTSNLLKFLLIVSPLRPKSTTLQGCFRLLYFKVFLLYQPRFIFSLSIECFPSCLCVTTFSYMLLHM